MEGRSVRRRRAFAIAVGTVVAAALAGLGIELLGADAEPPSGRVEIVAGRTPAPGFYVAGRTLSRAGDRQTLEDQALAPLIGTLAPVAVPSPSGRFVAYNSWRWTRDVDWKKTFSDQGISIGDTLGVPRVRVRDLTTRTEVALEEGTMSPAFRSDGALAYFVADPPAYRANAPVSGRVVVRESPRSSPVVWTPEPDQYVVLAWAGRTLIVYRSHADGGDILAVSGPGATRVLARAAGFLAVTRDGRHVVVDEGAQGPEPMIRVRSVTDGRETAAFALRQAVDPTSGAATTWVAGPGSWTDNTLLVRSSSGLLVLEVTPERIAVDQVIRVDLEQFTRGAVTEARFADPEGRTFVWSAGVPGAEPPTVAQYVCDRFRLTCTRSAPVPVAQTPHPVYDAGGSE